MDAYPSEVTFRWDYDWQSGASGFAFYCGASPRNYVSRTDLGKTDTFRVSVPEGAIQFCSVAAYDPAGVESDFSNEVGVSVREDTGAVEVVPPFSAAAQGGVAVTPTGLRVRFSVPFDRTQLNLFWSEGSQQRLEDMTLVGAATGPVRGSLVIDRNSQAVTYVKTGGVLLPDTYTVTIASRPDSVTDVFGRVLDGNSDGFSGDDYSLTFAVPSSNTPILGIGEFARGPGQPVNLPAADTAAGIPLRISNGAAVREVAFTLRYDPALLSIQDIGLARSVTGDLTFKSIDQFAGLVQVRVTKLSGLTDASTALLTLRANVPMDAPYAAQHLLDIGDLEFNAGALGGRDDDGIHVVANLGDATGEGEYSSSDATLIQRVIVRLDNGFSAYPLTDPVVLGDVNDNGRLDAADALLVQYKSLGRVVPQIPAINTGGGSP